jgi:hypothetical protein
MGPRITDPVDSTGSKPRLADRNFNLPDTNTWFYASSADALSALRRAINAPPERLALYFEPYVWRVP